MFGWTNQPSAHAPRPDKTLVVADYLIVMVLRSSIVGGIALVLTVNCLSPNFAARQGQ